jgi:predicted acylesterase/phospholipase RssA
MATQNYKKIYTQAQGLIDNLQQAPGYSTETVASSFTLSKQLFQHGELRLSRQLLANARAQLQQQARQQLQTAVLNEAETLTLSKWLLGLDEPDLARQLLLKLIQQGCSTAQAKHVQQQLALSTYKNDELPPNIRYNEALKILDGIGLRDPNCDDPETLGQAGAIYKRQFAASGRLDDLRAALHFYQRGWISNPEQDMGYCAVNAAFILDRLAYQSRIGAARENIPDTDSAALIQQANALRQQLLNDLPKYAVARNADTTEQWWYLTTLAEAAFGLGLWDDASRYLKQAKQADHFEWERQTTAKQLVSLARMQGFMPPADNQPEKQWDKPWQSLSQLLGSDSRAAFESFRGKVGLALSGGGFRASLYHLGVLARLAEVDALRSVEVLSTVSGGSIIGAHYYLALRKLLTEKIDADITRQDYIELVREVMQQFFDGVSENLRVRALASLPINFRMLFEKDYGRSNRMGELYESYLFSKVDHPTSSPGSDGFVPPMRPMHSLRIHPLVVDSTDNSRSADTDFRPKFANWRRRAKVPTLLLNTTSLNSGHNWHFTASWMGEPPGLTGRDIDMNERYRRLYYWQAPTEKLQHYPLGYAVAASAGVPTLFDPLELSGLYPERTIRLVDGGVHDNQGVAGLLDEYCDLILCSDASGQMDDQKNPAKSALSVFFRSSSIQQDRIREAQYQNLEAKAKSNALQGLFFIHLKQDLQTHPLDWINCDNPSPDSPSPHFTDYGIDRSQQRRLAEVRTDLDSFTEVEAYALMASGYQMTKYQLTELNKQHADLPMQGNWADFDINAPQSSDWPFSPLLPILALDPASPNPQAADLAKQLDAAKHLAGKAWVLIPKLKAAGIGFGLLLLVLLIGFIIQNWHDFISINIGVGSVTTAIVLSVMAITLPFAKYLQPMDTARKWLGLVLLGSFGWAAANIHLKFVDKWFKQRGKLQRLLNL